MKYYELLDVSPEASQDEIKAAYRIQVQLHHPDRLRQSNETVRQYAEEKLKRINEAYTVLSDPVRRSAYDARWRSEKARETRETRTENGSEDDDWYRPRRGGGRRRSEADAAREWMKWEAEVREAEKFAERQRRAAEEAERQRQAAEAHARHTARTRYPRVSVAAGGQQLTLAFTADLSATLVRIPAGEFLMGSDPARDDQTLPAERPQHVVRLSEFYIGQAPVTHQQYQAFQRAIHPNTPWPIPDGRAIHPVVNVSWDDALAFCSWLNAPGWRFRLPTEAEWEKAARGVDGRRFPWGEEWDASRANADDLADTTTPVGLFSPNGDSPFGAADMSGNVWEWCADWYAGEEYARRETILNPTGPDRGEGVIVRGGAYDSSAKRARCAQRNWDYPFKRRPNVGFRVVAVPAPDDEKTP